MTTPDNKFFDGKVICSILRDLRIRGASMTIQELSSRTGIDARYLWHLETNQDTEIKISTLITILDAMGYDLYIMPREPKKKINRAVKTAIKKVVRDDRSKAQK